MNDESSAAFRHAFLSERKTSDVPGIDLKNTRDIHSVAVIGAGTMGSGIATTLVDAGLNVKILDLNPDALKAGIEKCHATWERSLKKGRIKADALEAKKAAISGVETYQEIADCDLVIEAVIEQMSVKKKVFETLDEVMKPGAILATNTSTLNVDEIAQVTSRPESVLGLHFFSPANIMKLLEIVRGKLTADDVLSTALKLSKRIAKVPVVAGVCDGFIGNRMIDQYIVQAMLLIEEGATPAQVDKALEKWGMAMGPFRMSDVVGNDVSRHVRREKREENPNVVLGTIPDYVCEKGWFGQKTGMGWYQYVPGKRRPVPNPEMDQLLIDVSAELGITRRKISDEEIVQRCIFSLINEGAAILEEGIALRGSDIDITYLFGYGFPRFRGGPMFFADQFGLYSIVREMKKFARNPLANPDFWKPNALLEQLANSNKSLSEYKV
jgi:3-hydroxyacyl-CoA dehydrogenase